MMEQTGGNSGWRSLTTLTLFVICLFSAKTSAAPLYSVDIVNDELVEIESTTGAVTTIGSLGMDALGNIGLAVTDDGRLWALNADLGNRVDLWELNRSTGAVQSSVQVLNGGVPILGGEGLTAIGNQLLVAYSTNGDFVSEQLADLATDGSISNLRSPLPFDVDGMVSASTGSHGLYAFDREFSTRLYGVDPVTAAETLLGTYSDSLYFQQSVYLQGDLIAIDTKTANLYTVDLSNGASLSSPLPVQGAPQQFQYRGLVLAAQVGSPGTPALLLLILGGLFLNSRRMQRRQR